MAREPTHVLLVEDNPGDADLVSELVADAGATATVRIETARTLADAIARLTERAPDVVLLDLGLPDSAGIATVEAVQAAARRRVPIVVLTGVEDEATAMGAIHAGAQDYLVKGRFDGATLLRAVCYAIERSRLTRELDELREVFGAVVAHDLRTPIHAASLHTHVLVRQMEERLAKSAEVSAMIAHARHTLANLERMSRLVNDLMDTARGELGRFDLKLARISVPEAVRALAERIRPSVAARTLEVVVEGEPPDVDADHARFDQILTNLVDNAVKHSPEGSTIRIGVRAAGGGTAISITDQGAGIAADEVARLFDRFYQVRRARERKTDGGLGLGLYIARSLAQAHRGSVSVESRPGGGSTFTVWLPRAAADGS